MTTKEIISPEKFFKSAFACSLFWFEETLQIVNDNSPLRNCCGVKEIGEFPKDILLHDAKEHYNDNLKKEFDFYNIPYTPENKKLYAATKDKIEKYIFDGIKTELGIERSSDEVTPFVATVNNSEQSIVLKQFKKLAREYPSMFKFHKTISSSSGNELTIIVCVGSKILSKRKK